MHHSDAAQVSPYSWHVQVDTLQEMVAREGIDNWRKPGWQESGALESVVAAHQYRVVLGLLETYLGGDSPKDVLDWGCGSGAFSYAIAVEGHHVWATDPGVPPMDEFIRQAVPGRFEFRKADDPILLPYPDASFDVVLSNGCLEHVGESGGNDMASLEETFRVLRPGGVFICCHLPNQTSYIEAIARTIKHPMKRYFNRFVYSHQYLYSQPRVEQMAQEAGYAIEHFERYGFIPRNPLSALPHRLRDAPWFIRAIDTLDGLLERLIPSLCQNLAWVGRKPR
jgi:ubiquinone/menaquinone biosynthesis C-methylase UbiE